MNTILQDLNARRVMLGKSWNDLAEICQKEPSTVKKQLDPSSNPTLATLIQIARALNAEIRMVTPESIEASVNADVQSYRDRLNELQAEIDLLTAQRDTLKAQHEDLTARFKRQEDLIEEQHGELRSKDKTLRTMYASIEEKDVVIKQLLKEKGVL